MMLVLPHCVPNGICLAPPPLINHDLGAYIRCNCLYVSSTTMATAIQSHAFQILVLRFLLLLFHSNYYKLRVGPPSLCLFIAESVYL